MVKKLVFGIISLLLICGTVCAQDVTVSSLLNEMTDRDGLAKLPLHKFTTHQASSYSRKSLTKEQDGWFDNADASQFVRIDTIAGRREYVLMDEEGPGAIVRFWSTWHAQQFSMGTLRFYFDNAKEPQIEGRIDEIISSNKYVGEPLSQTASVFLENDGWFSGHNLYFPLPYGKHCKVTYQKADEEVNDVLYYQINYRKYDKKTSVKTYQKDAWENGRYLKQLEDVRRKLDNPLKDVKANKTQRLKGIVKAGEAKSLIVEGSRAIRQLSLQIDADELEQALRSTVIEIEFDDKEMVWVPIGDFFGTGYKLSPYKGWISSIDKDGTMTTNFPMPFQKSARINIHNYGEEPIEVLNLELQHDSWKWDDRSLYFHSNWRLYSDISTTNKQDVNYITISGKGKYVGDALTLFNNSFSWWGEGDEKIYVDNETFPSHFGTGTEDYYGYAWCSVVDFTSPFIAQPIGEGNRAPGITVNNRWRSLDVIPFDSSLKFDIEIWHWDKVKMDYAPTTYWYGTKESKAEHAIDVESVQIPVKLSNRYEGEDLIIKKINGGDVITQAFLSYDWSARNHLFWKGLNKNDRLTTEFYSEKERKGKLEMVFTQSPDYVIVDVYLNGKKVFEDLDLYNEKLSLKKYFYEDGVILKGNNTLMFKVKGTNDKSVDADKLGFDYLMIN
ncbi:DUF2961 domain-containing protein [Puteibacter caeruleilacunae]|nr:DUF2961 domain-containing protein [Puteibacter caeruleilacunae]